MHVLALTTDETAPFMRQQLAALEQRGVSFRTIAVDGDAEPGTSRGPGAYLRLFPRTLREARRPEYDLLHAHYGLTAPMALAQRQLPVVLSLWGSDVTGPVGPLSKLCAPRCDAVVVMSERMRETLGVECTVIPDGVDLELFTPRPRQEARADLGWPVDHHHVLFPYSPRRKEKNYPRARRVVRAVDRLLERPVHLQTVSGVAHERMPAIVNAADALLLTSRREGSPNSVKEALACNVPVVATDVGDVRERLVGVEPSHVRSTDRGLIDGLLSVLLRGERSNGRDHAGSVSLERSTEDLLDVYRSVAGIRASSMGAYV